MALFKEFKVFLSYPRNMRTLLITNFVYASVLPVIWAFVGVYIMRNTNNDVGLAMTFTMANYTGLLIAFCCNGFLLRIIPVKYLYSLGMLISGCSLLVMISLKDLNVYGIAMAGGLFGVSMGLFWANRDYLALASTTDENRNYYYGLENSLGTLCSIVAPITVGWFIAGSQLYGWFGGDRNHAYFYVAMSAITLAFVASCIVCQGKFTNPEASKFLYWKYDPLWYKVLWMEAFRGIGQGFLVTAPAMLVVKLIGGQEGALGMINSSGNVILMIIFYGIARLTLPKHRIWILFTGLGLFVIGCVSNMILFNATGVLIFVACQIVAGAFIECSFSPVMMLVIDILSNKEKRNKYAYLMNNEFALYVGRVAGGLLFIAGAYYVSDIFALRYILCLVAVIQFCSYFLCKQVLAVCKVMDAALTDHDLSREPHAIADVASQEER